jgi:hypothetical protein
MQLNLKQYTHDLVKLSDHSAKALIADAMKKAPLLETADLITVISDLDALLQTQPPMAILRLAAHLLSIFSQAAEERLSALDEMIIHASAPLPALFQEQAVLSNYLNSTTRLYKSLGKIPDPLISSDPPQTHMTESFAKPTVGPLSKNETQRKEARASLLDNSHSSWDRELPTMIRSSL